MFPAGNPTPKSLIILLSLVGLLKTLINIAVKQSVKYNRMGQVRLFKAGGDRSEAWDRETMFSQLAKRSSQNVDSGVCHNKYFRSTINLFEVVGKIYVYFVGGK